MVSTGCVPRTLVSIATVLGLTAPALAQNEGALKSAFEGRRVTVRIDMPGSADGVVFVESQQLRLRSACGVLPDNVGRRAEELADVVNKAPVRAPHRRTVLAVEVR